MSRNRADTKCACGYELNLSDCVTRPLSMDEYAKAIQWAGKYPYDCDDWVGAKAICPECGRQYMLWIKNNSTHYLDTSYWHSFNDEPCAACREMYS